jgi:hypothetical protein
MCLSWTALVQLGFLTMVPVSAYAVPTKTPSGVVEDLRDDSSEQVVGPRVPESTTM